MRWRDRRERLEQLCGDLVVRRLLGIEQELELGACIDLARILLSAGQLTEAEEAHLADFADLALQPERDFQHYCSLETSQHSRVDIVQCAAEGRGQVYVRKAITKDFAQRMRGQCSPFNERDLLAAALEPDRASPYIPRLLTAVQDEDLLHLFIEYLPSGTILDALEAQPRQVFPEETAKFWIAQGIQALKWVHDCGLAHRDVKPNNFLLTPQGHIKLTDFGSSAHFNAEKGHGPYQIDANYCMTPVGTVDYLAPDILEAHQAALEANDSDIEETRRPGSETYGPEVDWWSLGVTFYELLYGSTPFYTSSISETYEMIMRSEEFLHFPDQAHVSSLAEQLMAAMMTASEERIGRHFGADELQQHVYFQGIDFAHLHTRPSPFIPPERPPPAPSRQASLEPNTQLSALFASPGISMLRPAAPEAAPDQAWVGFTYLPGQDAFERAASPIGTLSEAVSQSFSTPAKPNSRFSSESASRSRDRRALGDNLEALKELADYGALKSAQKRRASSTQPEKRVTSTPVSPPPSVLQSRHTSGPRAEKHPQLAESVAESVASSDEKRASSESPVPSFVLAPRHLSAAAQARSRQTSLEDASTPRPAPTVKKQMPKESPAAVNADLEDIHGIWTRQARLASQLGQLENRIDRLSVLEGQNGRA